ncbi:hypothetical protein K1719_032371 [Acacia pycnantha]|nr:hypothetical protein K1719_032371 [Acacia pycnantha]
MEPLPPFNVLAAYDLRTRQQLFLSVLPTADSDDSRSNRPIANDIAYTAHPVDCNTSYSYCGLNGIAYVSKGYLLVVQSNTGKMFKVDANDGTATLVQLNEDLMGADDIALRSDGVVLVVSPVNKLWYLKSQDAWTEGVVFDKISIDFQRFPTSVVVMEGNGAYVGYGHVEEGIMGNSSREIFSIEEVRSKKSKNKHI